MLKSIYTIFFLLPFVLSAQENKPSFPIENGQPYYSATANLGNQNPDNVELRAIHVLAKKAIKKTKKGKYKYNLPIFQGDRNSYFTLILTPKMHEENGKYIVILSDLQIKNNLWRRDISKLISDDAVWKNNGKTRHIPYEYRKQVTAHMDQLVADLKRTLQEEG